jgi:alanine dehydrogenase
MRVGTIRETKTEEYRVGLTPAGVAALTAAGHEVLVESGAGVGSGHPDSEYESSGAKIVATPAEVAANVDILVKVKEILPPEYPLLRPGLIVFTYLHLAPNPGLVDALLESRVDAIAYESVRLAGGTLPLLVPMSIVAGRMAGEVAGQYLRRPGPGRGKLLGGVPGVTPARAVIVGSGNVGRAAAATLAGLGARTTILSRSGPDLAHLPQHIREVTDARAITPGLLEELVTGADVLIGAVLVPDGLAPKLVSREMVRFMGEGAVIVDVCIDQGGICETSHPTTHADPIYVEEGVIHYCVPNMPGAVPRTSTEALTHATLPYVLALANRGLSALREDPALAHGAAALGGLLTSEPVARAQSRLHTPVDEALAKRP